MMYQTTFHSYTCKVNANLHHLNIEFSAGNLSKRVVSVAERMIPHDACQTSPGRIYTYFI